MARDPGRHWSKAWLAFAACAAFTAATPLRAAEGDASIPADELLKITEPLLTSIAEEEARNGPYSANLVEMLTSLGLAYQEYGEDILALNVLDRALYLKRVNEGLFGMDQAALLERLIDSELKIGRVDSAEDLRGKLLALARRNRQDERSAVIFREAAEREIDRYETYLREGLPPTVTIGGDPMAPQREAENGVWRARRLYNEAMWALVGNPRENRAELTELEKELARTYYLEASGRKSWYAGPDDPLYGLGLMSYMRLVDYSEATASPSGAVDYARALVELADWSLLFSRNGTAMKRYEEAYDLLVERRVSAASIEEFFPTATPVFLPAFEPVPLAAVTGSSGYVDVDFEIGRYGQPRKVSIVAVAGDDAAAISKQLAFAIGNGRFRPSPVNGGAEYRLRYSLADGSLTPRL